MTTTPLTAQEAASRLLNFAEMAKESGQGLSDVELWGIQCALELKSMLTPAPLSPDVEAAVDGETIATLMEIGACFGAHEDNARVLGNVRAGEGRDAILRILNARAVRTPRLTESCPDDIRALGWAVAVHNDYKLNGVKHTFWLFTKGDRCVKGEGLTDADALNQVRAAFPAAFE